MMKKRHILHWAMGVVMTPLLGSCAFDELYEIAGGGNGMSFSVEVTQLQEELGSSFRAPRITDTEISGDNMKMYVRRTTEGYVHRHEAKGVATRGTSVSSIDKFTLNSYTYSTSLSSATQVSTKEEITKSDGWKSSKQWQKASDKMAFYAYYAGTSSANFSLSGGNPTLSYIVADDVANQQDLLVAKAENVTGDGTNKNIDLTFSHALTAVQFGIGSTMADGTIKKIELQGIMNSGTYNYSSDTWSSQSGNQTYTLNNLNIDISGNKGTTSATTLITGQGSSNDLMLLMPQTLGADAKLVVTIESKGTPHVLTMNLSGTWSPGHTVTYSLSTTKETGDYVLKVGNPSSLSTNELGGNVSTTVTSYYQDYYGTQTPAAWKATYTYASGTDMRTPLDKAITSKIESGSGNPSGETLNATIANQYLKSQYNFTVDADLKTKAQNSASPFDLSTYNPATGGELNGTDRRSANCYIIKAPGYYKLPLVFGNTLNNLANANGNSSTFRDANDTPITTEIINGVKGAKLLWQDEYGLIEPSSIRVDDKYLYFEIKEGSITQGNALIAATSGENGTGDILWSWHIWVTDADFKNKVLIYGGESLNYSTGSISGRKEFNFMKMPLGFCKSTDLKYPERKIIATIKQQTGTSDKETSVTITQTGSSSVVKSYGENCTFYQWGRKDPFPGSDGIKTTASNSISIPKYCYDADGNDFAYLKVGGDTSNGRTTKGGSIKNPYTFYYSKTDGDANSTANDWCNETTYNNWDSMNGTITTFADNTVVKSLYDPCPIGFKVPETTSFTGFTKTGDNNSSGPSYYNVTESSVSAYNEGWHFYTTGWKTGDYDFWRAFGFIDCWSGRYTAGTGKGFLGWSGLDGHYWSARAYSVGYGRYLPFISGGVFPRNVNQRAYGFTVRPVSEQ